MSPELNYKCMQQDVHLKLLVSFRHPEIQPDENKQAELYARLSLCLNQAACLVLISGNLALVGKTSFWKRQLTLVQNSMLAKGLPFCKYKEYQGDQGRVKASIIHGPISLPKESFSGACYVPGTVLGPGHTTED